MRILRLLLKDRKHQAWRAVRAVTGRGQNDQAARLRRLADFNTFLVKIYQCVDTARDETVLMQAVCDMAVRYAHLRVAYILQPGEDQRFVRLALSGPCWWGEGNAPTVAADKPHWQGTAGRAWHSGKPVFSRSFDQTPYLAPWRELARKQGLRANASLPIFRDGKVWAVLSVCDAERGTFNPRLQVVLEEAAQTISRGLERLNSRRMSKALLDKATVGIAVLCKGTVQKNNICLEQLCGVGKGDMVGRQSHEFYATVEDYERVRTAALHLWQDGRVSVPGVRVARDEGVLMIADMTGVPLGREAERVSVWTVEDVTRRDMNQRLYRGMLSAGEALRQGRGEMDKVRGVCEALVRDTFYHAVVVTRVDEEDRLEIVTHAGAGADGLEISELHVPDEQRNSSLARRAWDKRTSVYDNDLLAGCEDAPRREAMRARCWRAVLATPVWRGDTLWAVMSFISPYMHVFDAESITLFSGGLIMYFQPIMDLNTGRLFKVEALARLRDVNGEIVPPRVFLPLLGQDEMDRLFHIGLEDGLKWLRRWDEQGLVIGLSVNMPTTYLHNARGPAHVEALLKKHGIAPERLTVEILETHEIDSAAQKEAIERFKAMGVGMAIDDLGSGHSSLLRLSSLPFDVIKVDQGLLRHIRAMPLQIFSVVRSLLDIGADFHDVMVVEGLESEDIIEAMRRLGCQYGQGYGIARPMAPEALFDWHTQFQSGFKGECPGLHKIRSDLGALAFVWLTLRGGQYKGTGNMDDCALTQWLVQQGEQGQPVWHWAENLCYGRETAESAQLLINWLIARVQAGTTQEVVVAG